MTGRIQGALTVPNAAAQLDILADLRASRIACSVTIQAPLVGRPMTRVSWLLRQLKTSPPDLLVTTNGPRKRDIGPSLRLDKILDSPASLLPDSKFDVRTFTLVLDATAGTKRGQGKSSFVGSVLDLVGAFYEGVVQNLKPWISPAPKVIPDVVEQTSSEESVKLTTEMAEVEDPILFEDLS